MGRSAASAVLSHRSDREPIVPAAANRACCEASLKTECDDHRVVSTGKFLARADPWTRRSALQGQTARRSAKLTGLSRQSQFRLAALRQQSSEQTAKMTH